MNAELMEKAYALASTQESDQAGDLSAIKAVLRVAIEACANHLREMAVKETDTPALILAVAEEEIRALLD